MHIQELQPTIVDGDSYLTVLSEQGGKLVLKVLDVDGHMAKVLVTNVKQGLQQLVLDMGDLGSGHYILNAFNDDVFLKAIRFFKP